MFFRVVANLALEVKFTSHEVNMEKFWRDVRSKSEIQERRKNMAGKVYYYLFGYEVLKAEVVFYWK